MAAQMSEDTALLRIAIKDALDKATEPLSSAQVAQDPAVQQMGLGERTAIELANMYNMKAPPFPLKRIPSNVKGSRWQYFNPDVVQLAYTPAEPQRAAPPLPPVNGVKLPEFAFNPVDFHPPAPAEAVELPSPPADTVVKSITVTVAGITVKIDLDIQKKE